MRVYMYIIIYIYIYIFICVYKYIDVYRCMRVIAKSIAPLTAKVCSSVTTGTIRDPSA